MAISEEACRNHDELFPGHVSTLKVTDPELIEYFDNFAFDEVIRHGNLDTRTRLMAQLAALIACQALSEYRVMVGAALTVGVTPIEVKEIVRPADARSAPSLPFSVYCAPGACGKTRVVLQNLQPKREQTEMGVAYGRACRGGSRRRPDGADVGG